MAKSSRYEQWAKGYAPDDTTSFYGFVGVNERNNQLANPNPKQTGGYSAFAPVETVSEAVPRMAAANPYGEDFNAGATYGAYGVTPDWAKRTPTEQARVNAAQAKATTQGYAPLAPVTAPVSPYVVPESPYNYGAPKVETATKPAQNTESGATNPATPPETVLKTDAGSPSTGETEPTGYAKYIADNPELAEADRRAEAEYARSLPTYGTRAEQMAQAGIHGGYSDYLQGVAYAKMQDAKQQNEETARAGYAALTGNGGTVMSDTAKELYKNLLSEYGDQIAGITDETQYAQFEDLFRSANKGLYSDADVESALKQAREYRQTSLNNAKTSTQDLVKQYGTGEKTSDDILAAYGMSITQGIDENGNEIKGGETDEQYEARKAAAVRWVLSQAVKDGLIDDKELSATVTSKLAIYDKDFKSNTNWKSRGEDIYNSVSTAIDDKEGGILTDADLQTVLNDAITAMGVSTISLDYDVKWDTHPDLELKLGDGTKLKADYNGKASDTVADYLSSKYGNLPLVVYNNELYYQIPHDYEDKTTVESYEAKEAKGVKVSWYKLKTKAGSKGTPEQGDAYFRTVAKIMMYYNNAEKMGKVLDLQNSSNRYRTWDIKTGKLTYSKK